MTLNSAYNMMDKNGNLLKIDFSKATSPLDAVDTGMDLYKHTASEGMYFGNVSNEEPAVVKRIVRRYVCVIIKAYPFLLRNNVSFIS